MHGGVLLPRILGQLYAWFVYKELICEIFLIQATIPTVVNHIVFWGSFNAKFDSTIYTLHLSWFAGNINHGFSVDYSYLVSLILWSVLKANNNDDDDDDNNNELFTINISRYLNGQNIYNS